ncbi:transglutaminase domain-containing protein [Candidatus Sumerlaeota bacterium]|nr:transglutaminase domain-containing protein [Candidatus Sumerlaeota bacterium]
MHAQSRATLPRDIALWGLLLTECAALGVMSGRWTVALLFAFMPGAAFLAPVFAGGIFNRMAERKRVPAWRNSPELLKVMLSLAHLLLAIALYIAYYLGDDPFDDVPSHNLTYRSSFFIALYFYLLHSLMFTLLLIERTLDLRRFPAYVKFAENIQAYFMPVFGLIVVMFAGNRICSSNQLALTYLICVLIYIFWSCLFFTISRRAIVKRAHDRPARRLRSGALLWVNLALFALLCGFTCGATFFVNAHATELDQIRIWLFTPAPKINEEAFPSSAMLGSIIAQKQSVQMKTALRVFSEKEPGYLRAHAYCFYNNSFWSDHNLQDIRWLQRASNPPEGIMRLAATENSNLFVYGGDDAAEWRTTEVRPVSRNFDALFVPLDARAISIQSLNLRVGPENTLNARNLPAGLPYTVFTPISTPDRFSLGSEDLKRYLQLPDFLDPRVRQLADEIFRDAKTRQEKIRAVVIHFAANYRYNIGISIPQGEDPLTYFLLEKPAGHCEYFATGAAILLRLGGVPCRYVTGYVASEFNDVGNYWIARNRDAHAWIEALNNEDQWVTVEATVSAGVPGGYTVKGYWLDYIELMIQQCTDWLIRDSIPLKVNKLERLILSAMHGLFGTPVGLTVIAFIVAGIIATALVRRRNLRRRKREDPLNIEFKRLLTRMDKRMRRAGWKREKHETPLQFAQRLEQSTELSDELRRAAQWYREYSRLRYNPNRTQDDLVALKALV